MSATLGMIAVIKVAALIWQISDGAKLKSPLGLFLFLFMWPGISVMGFCKREDVALATGSRFLESWLSFIAELIILVSVSIIGRGEFTALNYVALFSILMIIHLGLIEVIADGFRLLGFSPRSLFDRPYLASSLRDFWSLRWNIAFVDMNRIFIMGPLRDKVPLAILTFTVFVISGILHEVGISYADGVSWGGPLLYFVIQGVGMKLEKSRNFSRVVVLGWVLLPVPLLFTPAFTNLFLGRLSHWIFNLTHYITPEFFYKYGLFFGGFLHLVVLCASVQVPEKLGWHEEFQKLSSLNRKVFWTYGAYIFSIIIFMSAISFTLAQEDFQSVSLPTFLWIVFISIFWLARVFTDFFYMSHEDWPKGPLFTIGHVCLTTVFISMAFLYLILAFIIYRGLL